MAPSSLATLTDLPHELLSRIIDPLDAELIYTLARTCKTLHFLALPVFLRRNGIYITPEQPALVRISNSSREGLGALQAALFAGNFRCIQCYCIEKVDRLFYDIHALQGLLARLPSIHSFTLGYYPPTRDTIESAIRNAKLDMQRWSTEFSALMDAVLQKSCQSFYVFGGEKLFADSHAPTPWKILPQKALSIFSKTHNQPEHIRLLTNFECPSIYINSSMFLHPHLLHWTQSTLKTKARALKNLGFNAVVGSSTWHQLLPTLVLPSLSNFTLSSDRRVKGKGVALKDVEVFLRSNPSIRLLSLTGIIIPKPTPRLLKPILPDLHTLDAPPEFIAWLFSCKVTHLRNLTDVTIKSVSGEFDYQRLDQAVKAVALFSQTGALRLSLNLVSKTELYEWMLQHVSNSMSPSGSIIESLTMVTDLNIQTRYWMRLDDMDEPIMQLLPPLFSHLEKINFGEQPCSPRENDLKGCKDLLKEILLLCPRLTTVSVNSNVIDLVYLNV
ncbi:hypothetical protein K443DRAFT_102231 [Laccaria amethystina LaAM-08-1]|jgi:hypothetical protein|uniref:F-box domain-containing protein n=1 Tax=Laccaria amethystina LaAM-08-1 TaxID=1095629 RepID=A0A0C9XD46_9AGAR|nr:hypothetical protein K443DRAFT_102231 [Laccaria amethystina LaAM-08-1]